MALLSDPLSTSSGWSYNEPASRDLRIDYLRGLVMFVLVVVHIEIFSLFDFLVWERIGVISGGEGFVILSGFVIGFVYRKKIERDGWASAFPGLVNRATQLYRVNVAIILSIAVLNTVPFIDMSAVMTWVDPVTKTAYPLFPSASTPFHVALSQVLLLRVGPHQMQILGLYVVLLFLSPGALWMFRNNRTKLLLAICWILYMKNWASPSKPTGAQFENAFPLLTWQLIYFHGMAIGYHRKTIRRLAKTSARPIWLAVSGVLFLGFWFFALNNPNPGLPDWAKLSVIPRDTFYSIYGAYFRKNTLGILRLVNYAAALTIAYWLLTRFWKPLHKALGWYLIPVGQASLYVFILHVYVIYLVSQVPLFNQGNVWWNTLGHALALGLLWLMVKKEVLFKWIPR